MNQSGLGTQEEMGEGKMLARFIWLFSMPSVHLNGINWPECKERTLTMSL